MCMKLVLLDGREVTRLPELAAAMGQDPPMLEGYEEHEGTDSCLCAVDLHRAAALLRCKLHRAAVDTWALVPARANA